MMMASYANISTSIAPVDIQSQNQISLSLVISVIDNNDNNNSNNNNKNLCLPGTFVSQRKIVNRTGIWETLFTSVIVMWSATHEIYQAFKEIPLIKETNVML